MTWCCDSHRCQQIFTVLLPSAVIMFICCALVGSCSLSWPRVSPAASFFILGGTWVKYFFSFVTRSSSVQAAAAEFRACPASSHFQPLMFNGVARFPSLSLSYRFCSIWVLADWTRLTSASEFSCGEIGGPGPFDTGRLGHEYGWREAGGVEPRQGRDRAQASSLLLSLLSTCGKFISTPWPKGFNHQMERKNYTTHCVIAHNSCAALRLIILNEWMNEWRLYFKHVSNIYYMLNID